MTVSILKFSILNITLLQSMKDIVPIYLQTWEIKDSQSIGVELKKCFTVQNKLQKQETWASFSMAYNISKHNKPFSESEFMKQCMVDVAEAVYPENKTAFENISLSRITVCCIEEMNSDLLTQLRCSHISL